MSGVSRALGIDGPSLFDPQPTKPDTGPGPKGKPVPAQEVCEVLTEEECAPDEILIPTDGEWAEIGECAGVSYAPNDEEIAVHQFPEGKMPIVYARDGFILIVGSFTLTDLGIEDDDDYDDDDDDGDYYDEEES